MRRSYFSSAYYPTHNSEPNSMSKIANRHRPDSVQVRVASSERKELQTAADEAGMALSVFLRVTGLEAARLRVLDREQRRRRAHALSDLAASDRDRL
jgi:hypothetical protein